MKGGELHYRLVSIFLVCASLKTCWAFVQAQATEANAAFAELPTLGIDLANASWPELSWLPGIGPKTAQSIVANRARIGVPLTVHSLDLLPGIGEVTAGRIADWYEQLNLPILTSQVPTPQE